MGTKSELMRLAGRLHSQFETEGRGIEFTEGDKDEFRQLYAQATATDLTNPAVKAIAAKLGLQRSLARDCA